MITSQKAFAKGIAKNTLQQAFVFCFLFFMSKFSKTVVNLYFISYNITHEKVKKYKRKCLKGNVFLGTVLNIICRQNLDGHMKEITKNL